MENENKRKRGRPKKVLSQEELNRPKRPRGRPRIEREEPIGEKRPRGRPKKERNEEELNKPKRPRGRPRKNEPSEFDKIQEIDKKELEQNIANEIVSEEKQIFDEADDDDLQKGSGYVKLQNKTAGIINSRVLEPLVPAKHINESIVEEKKQKPAILTPPLAKLNISRSKTPLNKNIKKKEPTSQKARPMPNKVIVITGATGGMGFAMARYLAALGHIVIGIGRKPSLCRECRNEILDTFPEANIYYLVADLSIMGQVKILADDIEAKVYSLNRECVDVLIHNAGIDLDEQKITYENNDYMWATNYLSAVLLTKKIQHLLDRSRDARVITFTSKKAAHHTKIDWRNLHNRNSKSADKIYEQTKLADLMWALEYDHRNAENETLHAYCVDPGTVNTTLRTQNASGWRRIKYNFLRKRGKTVEQGIETAVYLTIAQDLPKNVVFYANKKPADPSKFALDQDNRLALWRATEIDLRNE